MSYLVVVVVDAVAVVAVADVVVAAVVDVVAWRCSCFETSRGCCCF